MQKQGNDRRMWRGVCALLLCTLLIVVVSGAAVQAKTKNQGKIGKKIKWTYQEKNKTLTISGKGAVQAGSLKRWNASENEKTWLGKESGSLPMFKRIVFREGITEIDFRFFCLENVKSISLPKSFRKIRYSTETAIASLNGKYDPWSSTLTNLKVAQGNKKFKVSNGALVSKNGKKLYVFPSGKSMQRYKISNKVTSIGDMAFWGADIRQVVIGDRVKSIGEEAFVNSSIREVQFGSQCKKIGASAFSECELSKVQFPKSLETIGMFAFWKCPFTEVVLPVNLAKVGESAFADNRKLQRIVINGNTEFNDFAFEGTSCYEDEHDNKVYNPITVILGKKMKASVSSLCEDLGKYITFQVQQGNPKYYDKEGSLYTVRGDKQVYVHQEKAAEEPAATASPSPSPSGSPEPSASPAPSTAGTAQTE